MKKIYILIFFGVLITVNGFSIQDYSYSDKLSSEQNSSAFLGEGLYEQQKSFNSFSSKAYDPNDDVETPTPGGEVLPAGDEIYLLPMLVIYTVFIMIWRGKFMSKRRQQYDKD